MNNRQYQETQVSNVEMEEIEIDDAHRRANFNTINPKLKDCSTSNSDTNPPIILPFADSPMSTREATRSGRFEQILQNKCKDSISPVLTAYSFAGVFFGLLFTSTITLWPQHNVIKNPKYWYESVVPLGICLLYTSDAADE